MNPIVTYVLNFIIAAGALFGAYMGKWSWAEAAAFIGVMLVPSAGHVVGQQVQARRAAALAKSVAQKSSSAIAFVFGVLVALLLACGLTQSQVDQAGNIAAQILCAIEHAELDDPELEKLCGALTTGEKAALNAHRRKLSEAKVVVTQAACKDGGK